MSIVVILSAIALSGSMAAIRHLRFTNTFNKMVLMLQQARSLAQSGKDINIESYGVRFILTPAQTDDPQTAELFSVDPAGAKQTIESFTLLSTMNLEFASDIPPNCQTEIFTFTNGTAATQLKCEYAAGDENPPQIRIGLCEKSADCFAATNIRKKFIFLHKEAGIPQIQ